MFTHVSDAHGTTSWLDHVLCSQDMQIKLHSFANLDMLPSSDHVPLSFVFDFNSSPTFNENFTCPSNKTNFNWAIATDKDLTQNKETIRANAHANSLMKKDMTSFWKGIKKHNNTIVPLAPMVDNCVGDKNICDMYYTWQTHYKQLLNSVETSSSKKIVQSELHSIGDSSVIFCPVDIFNALKNVKTGQACGVDGLATEHFIYADAIIHNTFIIVI